MRRILVTSALPYANGPIHIGHLVEYLQTDIWVRFQKLRGNRCIYICADDTHGTGIMIRARDEEVSEEELISAMQRAHVEDFTRFDIEFDNYGSTHSPENRDLCAEIWASVRQAGLVSEREVTQLYDIEVGTFLADRFVKGTCPKCGAKNQYGDSCDRCGAHYSPTDLCDPVSTLTSTTPEVRSADHLFINVEQLHDFLDEWTQSGDHLQPEVANYLKGHFLNEPLRDWDVSRPAPYFGFEIPDSPGNYWYVWFDAPIGYIASTRQWCDRHGESFDDWWASDETEIHHFIGKDITYFHTLFWPAMLQTSRYSLPTRIHIHGFLTVNGEKMSKSKGTFVRASTYLEHLDPAYMRYYYASKLTGRVDDLGLSLDEFVTRINSDLVGNVVNLASRTAKFAMASGLAPRYPDDGGLFDQAARDGERIAQAYEVCDFNLAMRLILAAGDRANQFVEHNAPWNLHKDPRQTDRLRDVCTIGLNLFRQLAIYLSPVLPRLAQQTGELLHDPILHWDQSKLPLLGTPVSKFRHMMKRVDPQQVDKMIADSTEVEPPAHPESKPAAETAADSEMALQVEPLAEPITLEDFAKVDLRVARVLAAEDVPEASKLLKLTLSLGGKHQRTVFAGIKGVYRPEDLVGRLVVCVANLLPRKMKFGTSEGMVVAAGPGGEDIYLLSPDEGAKPGQRVH
ncbi:MAG: methionine--tRNA ligase [Planctomycetes bacterium RBG_13_63_9]|nr:MAG: methionine--tRNA ligase [Planctomycetes bacterium RBG_13_63_9]